MFIRAWASYRIFKHILGGVQSTRAMMAHLSLRVWYLVVSIPDLCTLTYFVNVVDIKLECSYLELSISKIKPQSCEWSHILGL